MRIANGLSTSPFSGLGSAYSKAESSTTGAHLAASFKVSKKLESKEIAETLVSKADPIGKLDEKDAGGLLTNALQELLKVTSELKELDKHRYDLRLGAEGPELINEQFQKLSNRFNKIVGSDTFKRAARVLRNLANSSNDQSEVLKNIDREFGKQGGDLKNAIAFGGQGSIKSLARIFSSLEELRFTSEGEIVKLDRNKDGTVNEDKSQAFKTELNLDSLDSLISSGLEMLSGASDSSNDREQIIDQAEHSIGSFIEHLQKKHLQDSDAFDLAKYLKEQSSSSKGFDTAA